MVAMVMEVTHEATASWIQHGGQNDHQSEQVIYKIQAYWQNPQIKQTLSGYVLIFINNTFIIIKNYYNVSSNGNIINNNSILVLN